MMDPIGIIAMSANAIRVILLLQIKLNDSIMDFIFRISSANILSSFAKLNLLPYKIMGMFQN